MYYGTVQFKRKKNKHKLQSVQYITGMDDYQPYVNFQFLQKCFWWTA